VITQRGEHTAVQVAERRHQVGPHHDHGSQSARRHLARRMPNQTLRRVDLTPEPVPA
jgi:hypothetical protein